MNVPPKMPRSTEGDTALSFTFQHAIAGDLQVAFNNSMTKPQKQAGRFNLFVNACLDCWSPPSATLAPTTSSCFAGPGFELKSLQIVRLSDCALLMPILTRLE